VKTGEIGNIFNWQQAYCQANKKREPPRPITISRMHQRTPGGSKNKENTQQKDLDQGEEKEKKK
jgi:hypothetical protein